MKGKPDVFRSTGSYEPDPCIFYLFPSSVMFRSTGSYEPDPLDAKMSSQVNSFDPQALTSLTLINIWVKQSNLCFDPQALTSLTPKATPNADSIRVSIHRLLRA